MYDYYRGCLGHIHAKCDNPNDPAYHRYGGRGITYSFVKVKEFRSYILENLGPRPSPQHSLDRIDNDGNYEPGNLRWALPIQQAQNRGERLSKLEWKWVRPNGKKWAGKYFNYCTKSYSNPADAYLQVLALRSFLRQLWRIAYRGWQRTHFALL